MDIKGGYFMFSILAILSDIPLYLATLVSELTGADMTGFLDFVNNGYSSILDAVENIANLIG